jgi:hypothetical protein
MLVSFCLKIVLILTQDRSTICAKRTTCSEIILVELLGDVGHVESRFVLFRDSVSVSARYDTVCAKCTIGSKSFWMPMMILLGDEAQVEAPFSPFGDSANLDARWMDGLGRTYSRLRNHFGCTRWNC